MNITSLEEFPGAIKTNIRSGTFIDEHERINASAILVYGWDWTGYEELTQYPGAHTFYLGLSLTAYSGIGPFKFATSAIEKTLAWNVTVIQ